MREIDTHIIDYFNVNSHHDFVCNRKKVRNEHGINSARGVACCLPSMTAWKQQAEQCMEQLRRPVIRRTATYVNFPITTETEKKVSQLLKLFCSCRLESSYGKL